MKIESIYSVGEEVSQYEMEISAGNTMFYVYFSSYQITGCGELCLYDDQERQVFYVDSESTEFITQFEDLIF